MFSVQNNREKFCHYIFLVLVFAALKGLISVPCAYIRASGDSIASASASQGWAIVVSLLLSRRCLELPLVAH